MRKEKLMSNENLQKMFVEDAPQQVNELENVRSLSNYVIDLQKLEEEIAKEETLLQQKKERMLGQLPLTSKAKITVDSSTIYWHIYKGEK